MIVINKLKKVIVFKAHGKSPLRLLPGPNEVNDDDFPVYVNQGKASLARAKSDLDVVDYKVLTSEEREQAKIAKARNDELNKANKLIKVQEKKLDKSNSQVNELNEKIAELQKRLDALEPSKDSEKDGKKKSKK